MGTHIEFDVFQCTVNDLVQSLTVDSRTVSKHMSRTSVRHDVILVHDTPRMVADAGRRPAAADGDGEKNRRQPGSPGKPNRLSNRTMFPAEVVVDHRCYRRARKIKCSRRRRTADGLRARRRGPERRVIRGRRFSGACARRGRDYTRFTPRECR